MRRASERVWPHGRAIQSRRPPLRHTRPPCPRALSESESPYLNRYTYLPRVKNQSVLSKAVHAAVSGVLPGPFACAERWDEGKGSYVGLAISGALSAQIIIDNDSVIIRPEVAEKYRQKQTPVEPAEGLAAVATIEAGSTPRSTSGTPDTPHPSRSRNTSMGPS